MATDSLNHFSSFVNQQINSLETINDNMAIALKIDDFLIFYKTYHKQVFQNI